MDIEDGGDNRVRSDREAEITRRLTEWNLDTDARNVFAILDLAVLSGRRGKQFFVSQLSHYKDYLTKRDGTSPKEAELTMRLSDPRAVAAFDRVVDEFNADVDRINREQDFETVRIFENRGFDLFKPRS